MGAAWFVDGSYAYKCWREVCPERPLDFKRLREAIERDAGEPLRENYYFNAESDPPSAKQDSFHKRIAIPAPEGAGLRLMLYWTQTKDLYWPKALGGQAVIHPTMTDVRYRQKTHKGVDVGIGYHMARSFNQKDWDKLYLMAGDGDFAEVVHDLVKFGGVDVSVIGTRHTISSELGPWTRPIYLEDHLDILALNVGGMNYA